MTGLKKNQALTLEEKRNAVDPGHSQLSIRKQCNLLGLNRSSLYYKSSPGIETAENLYIMSLIDRQYLETPFYGTRRITAWLRKEGYDVNMKKIQRLMRLMGIERIAPKPRTSKPHPDHEIYPYLLRNLNIVRPNQVWSTDITYCAMNSGFMYLAAIID